MLQYEKAELVEGVLLKRVFNGQASVKRSADIQEKVGPYNYIRSWVQDYVGWGSTVKRSSQR